MRKEKKFVASSIPSRFPMGARHLAMPGLCVILMFGLIVHTVSARAEDLPACGDYTEPELWFEFQDFPELTLDFLDVFEPGTLAPCAVSVDGAQVGFVCDGWNTPMVWNRFQQPIPFSDGDMVFVHADVWDYDAFTGGLCVFDGNQELILMHSTTGIKFCNFALDGAFEYDKEEVCEYLPEDVQPGYGNIDWYNVWGVSLGGVFNGSPYYVPGPASWATSDDGRYDIFLAINYVGAHPADNVVTSTIQVVPGPSPADDDADDDDWFGNDDGNDDADDADDDDPSTSSGQADDDGNWCGC